MGIRDNIRSMWKGSDFESVGDCRSDIDTLQLIKPEAPDRQMAAYDAALNAGRRNEYFSDTPVLPRDHYTEVNAVNMEKAKIEAGRKKTAAVNRDVAIHKARSDHPVTFIDRAAPVNRPELGNSLVGMDGSRIEYSYMPVTFK